MCLTFNTFFIYFLTRRISVHHVTLLLSKTCYNFWGTDCFILELHVNSDCVLLQKGMLENDMDSTVIKHALQYRCILGKIPLGVII